MGGGAGEHVPMSALARAHPMRDGMRHAPAAARCGVCLVAGAGRRVVSFAYLLRPADARLLPCAAAAARAGRGQYCMQGTRARLQLQLCVRATGARVGGLLSLRWKPERETTTRTGGSRLERE